MLSPTLDTYLLTVHLVAASIWVGGQFVVAGAVGPLRRSHPETVITLARAFGRLAWPAFVVLVLTGMWALVRLDVTATSSAYQVTLMLKIALAVASGAAAAIHTVGTSRAAIAIGGAVGLLAGLGAMALGVLLGTGA